MWLQRIACLIWASPVQPSWCEVLSQTPDCIPLTGMMFRFIPFAIFLTQNTFFNDYLFFHSVITFFSQYMLRRCAGMQTTITSGSKRFCSQLPAVCSLICSVAGMFQLIFCCLKHSINCILLNVALTFIHWYANCFGFQNENKNVPFLIF